MYYSKTKAKSKKEEIMRLKSTLEYLEMLLNENADEDVVNEYELNQAKLESYMLEKTRTLMFLSKARWQMDGEKSSKYFFALAKANHNKKSMYRLLIRDNIISDSNRILQEQFRFYDDLYRAKPGIKFDLQNKNNRKISHDEREALEMDITVEEIKKAISHFPKDKSPGIDGLTAEIYSALNEELVQSLLEAYNYAYNQGQLHITARRGYLMLIPKKGCNLLVLKSWRPLSILSMDYKILSKVLDNRLKSVMDSIIEPYQTGFMSGRYILSNIIKLMEIVDQTAKQQLMAIAMSVDFEKCFDRVDHTAVKGALEYFGFGPKFTRWTMLLFTNFLICTQNNGYSSDWIRPTSGLHQGCCISPHLFNLVGQIFAHLFENNPQIDRLNIHNIVNLLLQFADDTTIFSKGNKKSVEAITETLDLAHRNLGLKTNYDKTSIYRLGSLAKSNAKIYTKKEFAWADIPIYTLGIFISSGNNAELNLQHLLPKIDATLNSWINQGLTLMGRVLVVNSLVESMLVYRLSMLEDVECSIIGDIQKIIVSFVWRNKKARISFETLIQPKDHGGLRLADVKAKHKALLIQWIKYVERDSFLSRAMYNGINTVLGDGIWYANLRYEDFPTGETNIWRAVLKAWCKFNFHHPRTKNAVRQQMIWFNSHIKVNKKIICIRKAVQAGLLYLQDILTDQGKYLSFDLMNQKYETALTWLEYESIKSAVPKSWIDLVVNNVGGEEAFEHNYDKIKRCSNVTKLVYKGLTTKYNQVIPYYQSWLKRFQNLEITVYEKAFPNLYKISNCTKLRRFSVQVAIEQNTF